MQGVDDEAPDSERPSLFDQLRSSIMDLRYSLDESQLDQQVANELSLGQWSSYVEAATQPQVDFVLS